MKQRFQHSLRHAVHGLRLAIRRERNVRVQLGVALVVCIAGVGVGLSVAEWATIVLSITLVVVLELANTAIEILSDVLKPRLHAHIGVVKDVMAAAVLVAAIAACVLGCLVFFPYAVELLGID